MASPLNGGKATVKPTGGCPATRLPVSFYSSQDAARKAATRYSKPRYCKGDAEAENMEIDEPAAQTATAAMPCATIPTAPIVKEPGVVQPPLAAAEPQLQRRPMNLVTSWGGGPATRVPAAGPAQARQALSGQDQHKTSFQRQRPPEQQQQTLRGCWFRTDNSKRSFSHLVPRTVRCRGAASNG